MVRSATEVWYESDYLLVIRRLVPKSKRVAMRRMGDPMWTPARG